LLLVMALGVVIVAMRAVRQPANVDRIARALATSQEAVAEGQQDSSTSSRVSAVRSPAPDADETLVAGSLTDRIPVSSESLIPSFGSEILAAIKDNTYFRNAEKEAWFRFFGFLQSASDGQIEAAAKIEADYVQLVDQPDFYRGKFVTVAGSVRQVTSEKPAANDLGIRSYYRVVVQPVDGASWPIFVYCLEVPPELRPGDHASVHCKVTGLFFKNLSYPWKGGVGIAPIIVAKGVELAGNVPDDTVAGSRELAVDEAMSMAKPQAAEGHGASFREILAIAGWDASRLAAFDDGAAFSDDQRMQALQLLRRLRSFDSASIDGWVEEGLRPDSVLAEPSGHQGKLVQLAGRVTQVSKRPLASADAARLEMPEYFECELSFDKHAGKATVLTTRVPRAWFAAKTLNEPVTTAALYLRKLPGSDPPQAIWLAKEIAWHPTVVDEPRVSLGNAILGSLGMDVGLLDGIRSRGPIRGEEREAFYQMLDAAGRIGAHQLARFAQGNVGHQRDRWMQDAANTTNRARRALAQEVSRRANDGRYSVAPLFNEPEQNIGQLFTFDGVARRAVRIEVGTQKDGGPSDVLRRFGIDHYYEIEVFTDDSQNYPLVFCVRELPAELKPGASQHVPVRMAGFFFKDWLYTARGTSSGANEDADATGPRSQFAPLLVGRGPLFLKVKEARGDWSRLVGGSLFVLGLVSFGALAWWFARDERKFSERTRNANFSLDSGQSLDDLDLDATVKPLAEAITSPRNVGSPS
jgi:hypothetical protein